MSEPLLPDVPQDPPPEIAPSDGPAKPPRVAPQLSQKERDIRGKVQRAQRVGSHGERVRQSESADGMKPEKPRTGSRKGRRNRKNWLTLSQVRGMTEDLMVITHEQATAQDVRPQDQKNHMVGYGVATDKWLVLTGRPTQVIKFADAEAKRPAIQALALRIVRSSEPMKSTG